MKTIDFYETAARVERTLNLAKLRQTLGPLIADGPGRVFSEKAKEDLSAWALSFPTGLAELVGDPAAMNIVERFGFLEYSQSETLANLITLIRTANSSILFQPPTAATIQRLYYRADSFVSAMASLMETVPRTVANPLSSDGLLWVEVHDYGEGFIRPDRAALALTTLDELHGKIARALSVESSFRLVFADSGSPIAFGLTANKEVVNTILSTLSDGIRHLRFWREEGIDRRLQTLSKSLDVIKTIEKHRVDRVLDDETAGLLTHGIVADVKTLFANGVSVQSDDSLGVPDRIQTLAQAREVKLIGTGERNQAASLTNDALLP